MTGILLDKNGVWYSDGEEITHERTVEFLFKNVYFANGDYFMKGEKMPVKITVDDVAFFVRGIKRNEAQIEMSLSDGSRELLNFSTLGVGADNFLYCQIKDATVPARFERKAYNDLATDITERDGYYGVLLLGIFYPIQKVVVAAKEEPAVIAKPIKSPAKLKIKSKPKPKKKIKATKSKLKSKPKPKKKTRRR